MFNKNCFKILTWKAFHIFHFSLLLIHSFSHPLFLWGGSWGHSPRRSRNTSCFTATYGSSARSTPRQDQARLELQSSQLVLERPVDHFSVGVACMTRIANLSWGILVTWPHNRSWDLWIRKSGSTFKVLRISLLSTSSRSVTQWDLRKNLISAACTWDSSLPVNKQDSWA